MNTTLWSSTASNSKPLPARRSTDDHGARIIRILVAAIAAILCMAIAQSGHAATSLESQSLGLVNQARAANGLSALHTNAALDQIATQHAAEMVQRNEIFHYMDIGNRADAAGVHWTDIGENVGVGPSVQDVQNAFMQSPGHRQNILYAPYNLIGVGVAVAKDGSVFVAHEFATVPATSAPAPAAESTPVTQSNPVVHPASAPVTAPVVAPKSAATTVVLAKTATPPALNNTTSVDPNALLGNVVN